MTTIKWQPQLQEEAPTALSGLTATRETSSSQGVLPGGLKFFSATSQKRQQGVLASALDGALRRLTERVDAVTWPAGGIGLNAGLASSRLVGTNTRDLAASLAGLGQGVTEDRLLSRGTGANDRSGLSAGTYAMTLSLGGASEQLSVSLGANSTNGQVLAAVAAAVNAGGLPVTAAVRSQTAPGLSTPDSVATGSFLALSVDAARSGQAVRLADASGHLASWLGLSAPLASTNPVQSGVHLVTGLSAAKPSTFTSGGFDPGAETTLAPGTYTLNYAVGPVSGGGESGSVTVTVNSGDTWRDVLSRMARAFGSASTSMLSELVPARRVYDLPANSSGGQHGTTDGVGLTISENSDKLGWRLSLSGADAASTALLKTLGLNATAQPGADASAIIDGRQVTGASGQFTADSGRVRLSLAGSFGEAAPVSVSAPVERLTDSIADVLQSYNEVRGLLLKADSQKKGGQETGGTAEDWRRPVAERKDALAGLGLTESRTGKSLWFDGEQFLATLLARPEAVQAALTAADGLFPALRAKAGQYLSGLPGTGGVPSLLAAPDASAANDPLARQLAARTEVEVERQNQLLDLFDSMPADLDLLKEADLTGLEGKGGILRRKG